MSVLNVEDLKTFVRGAAGPCVSIYMPTHRSGTETAQDPIRLENLIRDAGRQLEALGHDARTAQRVLAPAKALAKESNFWPYQSDGLALLLADGQHVVHRLPLAFQELCVVGPRPHLKPLLPMLGDNCFFVIAMSQHAVRLFEGSRDGLRPMDLHDIPTNLGDVVGYDVEQKAFQFRTPGGGTGGIANRHAMFHGHGAGADDEKQEIEKFLRAVDDGIRGLLNGRRGPVIVAAAEPVASIFRNTTKLPDVLAEGPAGNFDERGGRELFDAAWKYVAPRFDRARAKVADLVREGLGTGRAVQRIEEVVAAARSGRVDAMLAATDAHRWGVVGDDVRVSPERRPGDLDLVDVATTECLLHGGTVHAVTSAEMPGDRAVVAAVLRF